MGTPWVAPLFAAWSHSNTHLWTATVTPCPADMWEDTVVWREPTEFSSQGFHFSVLQTIIALIANKAKTVHAPKCLWMLALEMVKGSFYWLRKNKCENIFEVFILNCHRLRQKFCHLFLCGWTSANVRQWGGFCTEAELNETIWEVTTSSSPVGLQT